MMSQHILVIILLICYIFWPILICVCQDDSTDQSTEQSIDEFQGKNLMQPPESPRLRQLLNSNRAESKMVSALLQFTDGESKTDEDSTESSSLLALHKYRQLRLAPMYERRFAMTDEQGGQSMGASGDSGAFVARLRRWADGEGKDALHHSFLTQLFSSGEHTLSAEENKGKDIAASGNLKIDSIGLLTPTTPMCPPLEQLLICLEQIEAREEEEEEEEDAVAINLNANDISSSNSISTSLGNSLNSITVNGSKSGDELSSEAKHEPDSALTSGRTEPMADISIRKLLQIDQDPYSDVNADVEPIRNENIPHPPDVPVTMAEDLQDLTADEQNSALSLVNSELGKKADKSLTGSSKLFVSKLQSDDQDEGGGGGGEAKKDGSRLKARLKYLRRRTRQTKQGSAQSSQGNSNSSGGGSSSSGGGGGSGGGKGKGGSKGGNRGGSGGRRLKRRSVQLNAKSCKG